LLIDALGSYLVALVVQKKSEKLLIAIAWSVLIRWWRISIATATVSGNSLCLFLNFRYKCLSLSKFGKREDASLYIIFGHFFVCNRLLLFNDDDTFCFLHLLIVKLLKIEFSAEKKVDACVDKTCKLILRRQHPLSHSYCLLI
jgi:hypothetical protein